MAKRPSVKEILEAARKGGAAKPAEESAPAAEEVADAAPEEQPAAVAKAAPSAPAAAVPTAASLGRPLTVKEKLAAARAGGATPAAPAAKPAAASAPALAEADDEPAAAEAPKTVPAPAKPLGRPMTLQEKLAAARGAGAGAAPAASGAKPAGAKPAGPAAAKAASGTRVLPPLGEITDPKDLAEAARQAAAKQARDLAAKAAAATPAKPAAKSGPAKPNTVPPRPTRELAEAETGHRFSRRGFMVGSTTVSWGLVSIIAAWSTFTAAISTMTLMTVRFMFPNVLAEPPSTIKVGLPTNYEPEEVSERFKAEWGFWIVRSTRYDGQDIIYALQSVCTHLGCPPNWLAAEQKFKCPCHGSGFYVSGINFEGPAPRPLERFKVALADDGQIMVDKSAKFQQELGQWADPDSFIPA